MMMPRPALAGRNEQKRIRVKAAEKAYELYGNLGENLRNAVDLDKTTVALAAIGVFEEYNICAQYPDADAYAIGEACYDAPVPDTVPDQYNEEIIHRKMAAMNTELSKFSLLWKVCLAVVAACAILSFVARNSGAAGLYFLTELLLIPAMIIGIISFVKSRNRKSALAKLEEDLKKAPEVRQQVEEYNTVGIEADRAAYEKELGEQREFYAAISECYEKMRCLFQYVEDDFPSKYRAPAAIAAIWGIFNDHRADRLMDAFNLYEQERFRKQQLQEQREAAARQEALQQESMRQQQQAQLRQEAASARQEALLREQTKELKKLNGEDPNKHRRIHL